jgi:hypothetical protein
VPGISDEEISQEVALEIAPGIEVDLRVGGKGQVVCEPSVHESGALYTWKRPLPENPEDIPELPTRLRAKLPIKRRVEQQPTAPVSDQIPKGQRDATITSLAGTMRRRGMSVEAITSSLLVENAKRCDPPLPEAQVEKIARSVGRYEPEPGKYTEEGASPILIPLADVDPEEVCWLWSPYIPLGKLTLLEGDPGLGKTWLALAITTAVSRGWPLPGGNACAVGSVLYATSEDGYADTLRPRLNAMDADASRITILDGIRTEKGERAEWSLEQLALLETALIEVKPILFVIDPVQAYLGASTDMHRANEVRPLLRGASRLAERYGCAVVAIRHLRKTGGDRAIYRGLGSIDFAAAARSVLMVGDHPDPEKRQGGARVVAQAKSSLAPKGPSLEFSLCAGDFLWGGEIDVQADDLASGPGEKSSAAATASTFLEEVLGGAGPVPSRQIFSAGRAAGISEKTLKRTKKELGIKARRRGGLGDEGEWVWEMPAPLRGPTDEEPDEESRALRGPESLQGGFGPLRGKTHSPAVSAPGLAPLGESEIGPPASLRVLRGPNFNVGKNGPLSPSGGQESHPAAAPAGPSGQPAQPVEALAALAKVFGKNGFRVVETHDLRAAAPLAASAEPHESGDGFN